MIEIAHYPMWPLSGANPSVFSIALLIFTRTCFDFPKFFPHRLTMVKGTALAGRYVLPRAFLKYISARRTNTELRNWFRFLKVKNETPWIATETQNSHLCRTKASFCLGVGWDGVWSGVVGWGRGGVGRGCHFIYLRNLQPADESPNIPWTKLQPCPEHSDSL